MKEISWIVTEEKAVRLAPFLRWIGENAPRKIDREAAKGLLGRIRGVKDWKQMLLTKTEETMIAALYDTFPEISEETGRPEQLRLFE